MADYDHASNGNSYEDSALDALDDASSSNATANSTTDSSLATDVVDDIPEIELIIRVRSSVALIFLSFFSLYRHAPLH